MEFITYQTDGDYSIPPMKGNVEYLDKTAVVISSNIDVAAITFGYKNHLNAFKAYADGIVTQDAVLNHGPGARLMVRIVGITSNPVVIGFSV